MQTLWTIRAPLSPLLPAIVALLTSCCNADTSDARSTVSTGQTSASLVTPASAVAPFSSILYGLGAWGSPNRSKLVWSRHDGASDGTWKWGPVTAEIGVGWDAFKQIFIGDGGAVYGIYPNGQGELAWYGHLGQEAGTASWSAGSGALVGVGWNNFAQVAAGPKGVIYAVTNNAELLWYRHDGYDGSGRGFAAGSGTKIGAWVAGDLLAVGANQALYRVRKSDGQVVWYRHLGQQAGTNEFLNNGVPVQIHLANTPVQAIVSGPSNVFYLITGAGDLRWFHHAGASANTADVVVGQANVGTGWGSDALAMVMGAPFPGTPTAGVAASTNSSGCGCPAGEQYWGGLCYPACPSGSSRTAPCTCQQSGSGTDCSAYGIKSTPNLSCPSGQEYYGGTCYKGCPSGKHHTAACTCANADGWTGLDTNCTAYGLSGSAATASCPSGQEYYGGFCYGACPSGTTRTAACTCAGSNETNCSTWGNPTLPTSCSTGGICSQIFEDIKDALPAPRNTGEGFGHGMATCTLSMMKGSVCLLPDLVQGLSPPTASASCSSQPPGLKEMCSFVAEGIGGVESAMACIESANATLTGGIQGGSISINLDDALCAAMGEMGMTIGVSRAHATVGSRKKEFIDKFISILQQSVQIQTQGASKDAYVSTFKTCLEAL